MTWSSDLGEAGEGVEAEVSACTGVGVFYAESTRWEHCRCGVSEGRGDGEVEEG